MTLYIELVHKFAPNGKYLVHKYQFRILEASRPTYNLLKTHPHLPRLIFSTEGALSLFYPGGFIALVVFLSKNPACTRTTCIASQADAVFATLGYVLWAASATLHGIEISNLEREWS
jgi:hypothetical protein